VTGSPRGKAISAALNEKLSVFDATHQSLQIKHSAATARVDV
jgi:hypothetical protein